MCGALSSYSFLLQRRAWAALPPGCAVFRLVVETPARNARRCAQNAGSLRLGGVGFAPAACSDCRACITPTCFVFCVFACLFFLRPPTIFSHLLCGCLAFSCSRRSRCAMCGCCRLGVKEENLGDYYRRKEENYRKVHPGYCQSAGPPSKFFFFSVFDERRPRLFGHYGL